MDLKDFCGIRGNNHWRFYAGVFLIFLCSCTTSRRQQYRCPPPADLYEKAMLKQFFPWYRRKSIFIN
jgi:hypothetical protein